jgi:NTE family protein
MRSLVKLCAQSILIGFGCLLSTLPGITQQPKIPSIPEPTGQQNNQGKGAPTKANLPFATPTTAPGTTPASSANLPEVVPAGRQSIGLVLDGGGALGLAHIGVLEWFEENHIPVDRITGASMGALIGGLYAEGHSAKEVAEIAEGNALESVFRLESDYQDLDFRGRENRRELPQAIQLGIHKGVTLRNSLLIDNGLNAFLSDVFFQTNVSTLNWNVLPIPFRCVATDLTAMRPVIYSTGSIARAVRASVSLPGVFPPVEQDGHYLVDGGVVDNLPTDIVKNDLKADVIIAVTVPSADLTPGDVSSIIGVLQRSFSAQIAYNEAQSLKIANIIIEPQTKQLTSLDYDKAKYFIETGYKAAEAQRTALLKYALDDDAWRAYLADKNSRRPKIPGRFDDVQVKGGTPGAQAVVKAALAPFTSASSSSANDSELPKQMNAALLPVMRDGRFKATYTLVPSAEPSTGDSQNGILVRLREAGNGPPYLLVGASVTAASGNVTRQTFDLRLNQQDFGGYGSELRTDLRLGFLTHASTEYYRLLTGSGFYLKPRVEILRQPVYIYANQRRIQERFQQNAGGSIDLGKTFSPRAQAGVEWTDQSVRWDIASGNNGQPAYSVSTEGMRLQVSAGYLYNTVFSENAPVAHLQLADSHQFGKDILSVSFRADSYFRNNVADPLRFSLGGPLTLSASSIDEYRGTDDYLARAAVLRRFAQLPTSIGQGLYAVIVYEGGEVWSPEKPAFLRQDGTIGVLAATPLGAITFGTSIGDAGRRKVFFTFGRLF